MRCGKISYKLVLYRAALAILVFLSHSWADGIYSASKTSISGAVILKDLDFTMVM